MSKSSKKSNNKNKAKQEAHKRLKRIRLNIARANQCETPLSSFLLRTSIHPSSCQDDEDCTNFDLAFQPLHPGKNQDIVMVHEKGCIQFHKDPLKDCVLESCLALFQANMAELYKQSSWGLNIHEKREELKHCHARFLIVKSCKDDSNNEGNDQEKVLAFSHFRFEVDDEDNPSQEVLYLYEIQIDSSLQRNGLGKRLMDIIERIAQEMKMRKVVLTVFKHNQNAMRFYERLNYMIDDTSPSQFGEHADYEILSKVVFNGGNEG